MKRFLVVLVLLAFVTPAMADDLFPPDFRGDPLSYHAEWLLFTNGTFGTGIYTDVENAVDDSDPATTLHNGFSTHLDFDPSPGWAMAPGGGFHNPLSPATFVANVVNWIDWESHKFLRIQVTWADMLGNGPPVITDVLGYDVPDGGPYFGGLIGEFGPIVLGPFQEYYYQDWFIEPNPDWEQIQFILPMGTIVEQIVIDTVSAPEPATLLVMAAGLPLLLKRKRKSRA